MIHEIEDELELEEKRRMAHRFKATFVPISIGVLTALITAIVLRIKDVNMRRTVDEDAAKERHMALIIDDTEMLAEDIVYYDMLHGTSYLLYLIGELDETNEVSFYTMEQFDQLVEVLSNDEPKRQLALSLIRERLEGGYNPDLNHLEVGDYLSNDASVEAAD